jgi:polygalacturonase
MGGRGIFDITAFGAVGDGEALNTAAIQAAVDACTAAGGGRVYVPPGTFLTGTVLLKDHVTLYLENGATLLGSADIADYAPANVVRAVGAHHVGIAGQGTIDGQGHTFWVPSSQTKRSGDWRSFGWIPQRAYEHPEVRPDRLVLIEDCCYVTVEGITLQDAECWTLHIVGCSEVVVRGVRVHTYLHGPNVDGIDICSSQNVTISDCIIYAGDDAICLKNEDPKYIDRPCRDIVVTNCVLCTTCNAFKIGTGTKGVHEHIVFSNSVIKAADPDEVWAAEAAQTVPQEHYGDGIAPMAGIAIETVDGAATRDVCISNIVMRGARAPIFIRRANRASLTDPDAMPGELRNVIISNVVATDASTTSSITGLPGYPVIDVTLADVRIETKGGVAADEVNESPDEEATTYPESRTWGQLPASGLYLRHAEEIVIRNVKVTVKEPDSRPLLIADDVSKLQATGFRAGRETSEEIVLIDTSDVSFD